MFFLYWLPVPPTITEAPKDTTVNEGDPLQLTCKASGQPTPTITWTKDDNPLGKPPNIQKSDRTDAGKYVCRADNKVKEAKTASAQVTVQCKFDKCQLYCEFKCCLTCNVIKRTLQIHLASFCLLVVGMLYLFQMRATT